MKLLVVAGVICLASAVFAFPQIAKKGSPEDEAFYKERCEGATDGGTKLICWMMEETYRFGVFIYHACLEMKEGPAQELCNRFVFEKMAESKKENDEDDMRMLRKLINSLDRKQ